MALAATGLKLHFSVALHLIAILPPLSGTTTNLEVEDAEDERRRERDVESELKL